MHTGQFHVPSPNFGWWASVRREPCQGSTDTPLTGTVPRHTVAQLTASNKHIFTCLSLRTSFCTKKWEHCFFSKFIWARKLFIAAMLRRGSTLGPGGPVPPVCGWTPDFWRFFVFVFVFFCQRHSVWWHEEAQGPGPRPWNFRARTAPGHAK